MERRIIYPWTWQDQMGYVQANEVSGAQRTLFLARQGSVDEDCKEAPARLANHSASSGFSFPYDFCSVNPTWSAYELTRRSDAN
jgi:hypothetical protein